MSDNINKPNKKYDHIYVVLRYDDYDIGSIINGITGIKAYLNEIDAKKEAARLNDLMNKKSETGKSRLQTVYFVRLVRAQKGILGQRIIKPQ
jgi:DNA polymerase III alpha subunit (gram-positive type)